MEKVAIIGLGLIGASLGLALKRSAGWQGQVIGYSRRPETGARAVELGAIDQAAESLEAAVADVKLVVLATPIGTIQGVLTGMSPYLQAGTVVTDTASTKTKVMEWASACLPDRVSFVGGHPMAGKETWGIEAADAGLFRGASYCLVSASQADPRALARVRRMVRAIGARPVLLSAEEHDHLVAGISHLPLLLATALVSCAGRHPSWPRLTKLAAGGFRDTTRLASGSPIMGRDICLTNREAIIPWLDAYLEELKRLRHIVSEDGGLEAVFDQARRVREKWLKLKGWGG